MIILMKFWVSFNKYNENDKVLYCSEYVNSLINNKIKTIVVESFDNKTIILGYENNLIIAVDNDKINSKYTITNDYGNINGVLLKLNIKVGTQINNDKNFIYKI